MLELQNLLLLPWTVPAATPADVPRAALPIRVRTILDPANERALGFACEPPATRSWWPWAARPALAVYETEDVSLLFTVYRFWALTPKWEVRDADGHRLGIFRPPLTQRLALVGTGGKGLEKCQAGQVREWCRRSAIRVEHSWKNPAEELAVASMDDLVAVTHSTRGTLLTFAEELAGKPFAKMVVLAAVLSAEG